MDERHTIGNAPFTLRSKNTWMTTAFDARYPLSFTGCLSVVIQRLAQFFDDDGIPLMVVVTWEVAVVTSIHPTLSGRPWYLTE